MSDDAILALRRQMMNSILARIESAGIDDLTHTALAETLGITRARLYQLRARDTAAFSMEALTRIALALGMNVRVSLTRPYVRD